jgi:hypothetical protein
MSYVQLTLHNQAAKISDELFQPYREAASLLQDENLVWDEDFNTIRKALALALRECATTHNLNPWFLEVAYKLIDTTRANA